MSSRFSNKDKRCVTNLCTICKTDNLDIISKYFHKGTRVAIEAEPYNTKRKIGKGKAAKEYTFVAFKIINILNISDSVNSPEEE